MTEAFKTRRAEYADATREALLDAARELFTAQGYQQVSLEAIAQKARVTRGAFYHHFSGKPELLDALVVALQAEATARVRAASAAASPSQRVGAGIAAFLDVCSEPAYRHLVLETAVAVLGAERSRDIEEASTFGLLTAALQAQAERGSAAAKNVPLAARMIGRMVCESALLIDSAEDEKAFKADVQRLVKRTWDAVTAGTRPKA
ncbi:helix-turn-helix domain-containing protein [Paraburkholderia sp. J12]|uniref:TetR/AcrR family transcriptional regulator n=1 Tax=Paraburkholderia sp. J12 TaxID=2805432 RepID=UPI002ABDD9C7|nr:helix-turn-helix domain-containing protein [Paraburkholderia sp. J12]